LRNIVALVVLTFLVSPAFGADDVPLQGRPGVVRLGDKCFKPTDIYGDFRDMLGHDLPCDAHYTDAEQIAGFEFGLKTNLKRSNSPRDSADLEAWQASAAAGAITFDARLQAYFAE
jgi:hypothetical protein